MFIREYKSADISEMAELFYNTVHTVNKKDYTESQLNSWASGNINIEKLNNSFLANDTAILEYDNRIVGFGDMTCDGYLDHLFVHKDYQRKGIATMIVNHLEENAIKRGVVLFTTYASITARPFFENRGYTIVRENVVVIDGIEIPNFFMEKIID